MFTIYSQTRGLAKERRKKTQTTPALLFAGIQLILHSGCRYKVTPLLVLDSASCPIHLEKPRLPFPILKIILSVRDEFTSWQCQREGVFSVT